MLELSDNNKWRQILRSNFTNWKDLADFLQLDPSDSKTILKRPQFPLNLPRRLADKVEKGTLQDPILKQFLPLLDELAEGEGYSLDPVGDQLSCRSSKFLHKYNGRALILATSACAMHCRFCFRQKFPYDTVKKDFEDELQLIRQDVSINEVILSGGDPLSLGNDILKDLLSEIARSPHVKKIRFHTRFPIGIPERVDEGLLEIFKNLDRQLFFVIHCNHFKELDEEIFQRLKALQRLGVVVLSQTVLLRGINDTVKELTALFRILSDNGVIPYYLHQLDKVKGTTHFEVSESEGKALVKELRKSLPGYAVPRYVKEIAGELSKIEI